MGNVAISVFLFFGLLINAHAERYALLVGVSEYPALGEKAKLHGPANDAELVYRVLQGRGFNPSNMLVLSDGPERARPTNRAIQEGLLDIARKVKSGDFVYLHFSGHGSRQPASVLDNVEPDGLDEIFLPSDASGWDKQIGFVRNALTDNDIAKYLDLIRSAGADVWAVFDSCHSGTMTRGGGGLPGLKMRSLPAHSLGIPTARSTLGEGTRGDEGLLSSSRGENESELGALTVFSAAQPDQTTPELILPLDADGQSHGLFTYMLMDALQNNGVTSYAQIGDYIINRYRQLPWRHSAPFISGSDLSSPIFGQNGESLKLWKAKIKNAAEVAVEGGQLHSLVPGTELALYRSSLAQIEDLWGMAVVNSANALSSTAKITFQASKNEPKSKQLYAKRVKGTGDSVFTLMALSTGGRKNNSALVSALEEISKTSSVFRRATDPNDADIRLAWFEERIWFLLRDQSLPCAYQELARPQRQECMQGRTPQPLAFVNALKGELTDVVHDGLMRIARAETLVRTSNEWSDTASPLDVRLEVVKRGEVARPIINAELLYDGDRLKLEIANSSRKPHDVSVLYKDGLYGITQLFPDSSGEANRLLGGEKIRFEFAVHPEPEGMEDIIVISQQAEGNMRNFAFLEQEPMGVTLRGQATTRSRTTEGKEQTSPVQEFFEGELYATQTKKRGVSRIQATSSGSTKIFSWEVRRR